MMMYPFFSKNEEPSVDKSYSLLDKLAIVREDETGNHLPARGVVPQAQCLRGESTHGRHYRLVQQCRSVRASGARSTGKRWSIGKAVHKLSTLCRCYLPTSDHQNSLCPTTLYDQKKSRAIIEGSAKSRCRPWPLRQHDSTLATEKRKR